MRHLQFMIIILYEYYTWLPAAMGFGMDLPQA